MTVYAKIENGELITAQNGYKGIIGLAECPELCLENGFEAYTEEEVSGYFVGTHKIIDGVLADVSGSEEYKAKISVEQKEAEKIELQAQIDELDIKRIRALSEGGETADGTSFLEYYTNQIKALRAEITELTC